MIANPSLRYYQYNPYTKRLTVEKYDQPLLLQTRKQAIENSVLSSNCTVGVIMGVLGRQGSPHIIERIIGELKQRNIPYLTLLVSEISVEQLKSFGDSVSFFVQVACPRLSIDWGTCFSKPLLSPYEFYALLGKASFGSNYPMDYYSDNGGEWTNFFHKKKPKPSDAKSQVKLVFEDKPENN